MLSFFRRGVWAKLMLVILGIALFALVATGFGSSGMGGIGVLGGPGRNDLASVDGRSIAEDDARDQVRNQLKRMQQQNPSLDMAAFLRSGALDEIVDQLVTVTSRLVFAERQGLTASRAMVDRQILAIPAFQNLAGKFDQNAFRQILDREGITESRLREDFANSLIEQQLLMPIGRSAHVPQAFASQYASLLLESRTGGVGAVPVQLMGPGTEPTDAEVAAFFRSNQARYTIPERRVIRYAVFGPEQVAAQARATDAEIAALYRQNAAAYAGRETRGLSQVILPDQASAKGLADRIAGGTNIAAAAALTGRTAADTALPEQDKAAFARLSSAAVANAAFAAAKGATIGPVKSPLGWHVVRVEEIRQVAARPLGAVRAELAARIEQGKSQEALQDLATRMERAFDDGSSFDEVIRAEKLAVVSTPAITAAGTAPGVAGWQAPPELAPLLEDAFNMSEDDDPQVVAITPNQRFALVGLSRIVAAAPPPFAQIRDRVKADLIAKRQLERARAVAAALVSKINAGTPPAAAFAQADVRLPPLSPLSASRREIARADQRTPPPQLMLFNLQPGKARLLPAPDNKGWLIVYLDRIVPGNAASEPPLVDAVRSQFAQILGEEYVDQFTRAIQEGMKIKRNPQRVAELRAKLAGGGGAQ
jgi:peptidyl-prolyl cis-trans isomerase D